MSAKFVALFLLFVAVSHAAEVSDAKTTILNVLLRLKTRSKLSNEDLSILKTADEDDLPASVKRVVAVISGGAHTCCKSVPTTVVTRSRAARRVRTAKSSYMAGYSHCGLWGWGRCARYDNRYREVVYYSTEYYKDSVAGKCPEADVVCCHMYVNVSGRCVHIHDLNSVANQLVG